jgi:hypothetical protein
MRPTALQCLGTLAAVGILAVAVTGSAREIARERWENGSHFVSGNADPDGVSVTLAQGVDHECFFSDGIVYVPTRLEVADPTLPKRAVSDEWVTLHVTAAVTSHRGGDTTVTSAVRDEPIRVGNTSGSWVHIPVDASPWAGGSAECAVTKWTMTPGAWLPNDD